MENYDINQLALITGFTTRTLRNHINMGLLEGDRWQVDLYLRESR